MYYVTFMNEDNEFICCQCGTVVNEEEWSWSLEQINEMFVYDFDSEQLGFYKHPQDVTYVIEDGDEPTYNDNWRDACGMLWEAMTYLDDEHQAFIKKIFEGFKDLKALIKMVDYAS